MMEEAAASRTAARTAAVVQDAAASRPAARTAAVVQEAATAGTATLVKEATYGATTRTAAHVLLEEAATTGATAGTAVSKDGRGPESQGQDAQRSRRAEEMPRFRHGYSSIWCECSGATRTAS